MAAPPHPRANPVLDPEDPWGLGLLDLEDEHGQAECNG